MNNPYTGDMPIDIEGERLTLAFDYRALARVRAELGATGQAKALAGDVDLLPRLIAAGLQRHHPEWTEARVAEASPPIVPTVRAAEAALLAAYYGPDGEPDEENPRRPPETPLRRLWRRLTGRAWRRPNSGA